MWRRLESTFDEMCYREYDSVHFIPGCGISKMNELVQKYCTQSQLIAVNAGINNLLNGWSVSNCMREYERCYRAVMNHRKTAHLAFASLSYVADNKFSHTDDSAEVNVLIDDLNSQLKSFCEEHDRVHFFDLRDCLSDGDFVGLIARRNLALDGLHFSRHGIKHVACALVRKVCALKSTIVTEVPVSSGFVLNNDAFPKLPVPEVSSRIHPATYPGQQYVTVNVRVTTGKVNETSVEPVKPAAGNLCKSSVLTRKRRPTVVRAVAEKLNFCSKSQLQSLKKQTCSRVVRDKQTVTTVSFVHNNRFSVLSTDTYDDLSDSEPCDVHSERTVYRSVTSTRKRRKFCGMYRTTVPHKNADCVNVTKNTVKVESPLFSNQHRVSCFSSVTYTKSCFIAKFVTDDTYCNRQVRRSLFVFHLLPQLLDTLQLSISDQLVSVLLRRYGICLSTTNKVSNTEAMTVFSKTDTLIDCMLKVLLRRTQPSNDSFLRVIQKTGKCLLKYSNLYGTLFTSCLDSSRLHSISTNNFDVDLLILCGDVESNPGPKKSRGQKQRTPAAEYQMEIDTDDTSDTQNASVSLVEHMVIDPTGIHSSVDPSNSSYMDTESNFNTLTDCFGNQYAVIKMSGTGFCGFHCLSYSLTGNASLHSDIIEDCINVFMNVPDLYRTRTNYGSRCNSSLTESHYASFMRSAIQLVQQGFAIHSDAWAEDGHFAAISVLHDIVIFTYSTQDSQWYVFNEAGTRGYICMLSLPGHFDILTGIDGAPVIPLGANTHCISRDTLNMSNVNLPIWQHLRRNYSFRFVHQFPEDYAGVNILNNPVVIMDTTETESCNRQETSVPKLRTRYVCDFDNCTSAFDTEKALRMHKIKKVIRQQ